MEHQQHLRILFHNPNSKLKGKPWDKRRREKTKAQWQKAKLNTFESTKTERSRNRILRNNGPLKSAKNCKNRTIWILDTELMSCAHLLNPTGHFYTIVSPSWHSEKANFTMETLICQIWCLILPSRSSHFANLKFSPTCKFGGKME